MTKSLNDRFNYWKTAGYCLYAMGKEKLLKKHTPLAAVLYLTYKCNQKCPFCEFWRWEEQEMTTSEIVTLIDQLKTAGTQRLGLMGGEATLREDIGEIINYSKKKGLITTLCSNGKMAGEKIVELKNLDILILSLDGPQEIHDKLRGKGSYEAVIKVLEKAKAQRIKVWLTTLLVKENVNCLEHTIRLAQYYGLHCSFQPAIRYSGSAKNLERFILTREEVQAAFNKIMNYKKAGYPIALSRSYLKYMCSYWPEINSQNLPCFAGRLFCIVSPAGNVFACQPDENRNKELNVLKAGFIKAFNNLPKFSCQHCFCDSFIETNLLFNADIFTMWNTFKTMVLFKGAK